MTIQETKLFIIRCIKTCETYEQCDLMLNMLYWAVIERYAKDVEMEVIKKELTDLLIDQKMQIIWNNAIPKESGVPTLDLHANDDLADVFKPINK